MCIRDRGWPWGDAASSDTSTPPESTASEPSDTPSSSDPSSVPPQPEPQTGGLKAFYAPLSLLRDEAALGAQLDAAGAAEMCRRDSDSPVGETLDAIRRLGKKAALTRCV